jgi:hypothetical protein
LTYYHANRAEIENILDRDDAEYERLMGKTMQALF